MLGLLLLVHGFSKSLLLVHSFSKSQKTAILEDTGAIHLYRLLASNWVLFSGCLTVSVVTELTNIGFWNVRLSIELRWEITAGSPTEVGRFRRPVGAGFEKETMMIEVTMTTALSNSKGKTASWRLMG
ncbi:hypothetical protein L484_018335 [Morus notabilis]|uniref:Uncharacterized protein n=1 Tax=Morus notabilis TaxID=981085 RepID=W9QNU7_9ROSA|nr:hypothetical protein L484_018335 [Morus notabilis]